MDLVKRILTPKTPILMSAVAVGVLVALGLVANKPNPQNKTGLSPLGYDTSVVGPFQQSEIKALWEQWRLDAQSGNTPPGFENMIFNSCYNQFPVGSNIVQAQDTIALFGYSDIESFTTQFGSGWFVEITLTDAVTGAQNNYLYRVVANVNTNAPTVPFTTVTHPFVYRLSYVPQNNL